MNYTLLRTGGALLMGCFFFVSCSKSSQMAELTDDANAARVAGQRARTSDENPLNLPYAPIAKDSIELMETDNPQDQ